MLGERLTTLLSLISQDEYKTVDEFAQKMSLSTKTVRGLLQELNGGPARAGKRLPLESAGPG